MKKGVFSKFHKIHRKRPVPVLQACNFIKQEALAQVLSCEFCEISKNTFFTEHLWTTASIIIWIFTDICIVIVSTKFVAQRHI